MADLEPATTDAGNLALHWGGTGRNRAGNRRAPRGDLWAVARLLILGVAFGGPQAAEASAAPPPGVLLDVPFDFARQGPIEASKIQPQQSGAYLFELRYAMTGRQIDSKLTNPPRTFIQPYHEAFGGRVRLEVTDRASGRKLTPAEPHWLPIQIATSGREEVCADRLEFYLQTDHTYDVLAACEEPPSYLQTTNPRLMIEAANSTNLDFILGRYLRVFGIAAVGILGLILFLAWNRFGKSRS